MKAFTLLLLALWPAATLPAAPSNPALTLDRIFGSDEFKAENIGQFHWSQRAPAYFTLEAPRDGGPGQDLVRTDAATGGKETIIPAPSFIPPGETRPLAVDSFELSDDETKVLIYTRSQRVWRRNTRGDYWVLDLPTRQLRKLGGNAPESTLMFARFSPDARRIAYVQENNLYVQELAGFRIQALTTDGSATIVNGTSDWVNEEELDIRDGYRWSPDSQSIAFWQFDTAGVRQFHLIDNTADKYPRLTSFPYPKVGETNSAARLGVVNASGGEVRWLQPPGDPRNHYLARMEWTRDGSHLMVQQFNRLQNTNRVMLADPQTGATRTILTETDASWLENENPARWIGQDGRFLWLSERSGWRQAYLANPAHAGLSPITENGMDVIEIEAVDEKNGWLYYAASPENPTQRHLYRTRLGGGPPEKLSPSSPPGWHEYDIAPDAKWAIHTYSTFGTPPIVELVRLPGHEVVRVLVDNQKLRSRITALGLPPAEFFRLEIGGLELDAWSLKPPGFSPAGKYPLFFYVYGEPHGQTVRDAWPGQRGLWHWMLAQQGYLVASVDNRGTMAPRGRAWRKCVHRQIGILASQEQAAATRALLQRWPFADPQRVGIWGWSGGGSMSLNAIFRYPGLYRTAMAVAPNANQLLYDTIYQERYMGLPSDNATGYREGSPITYAHQLRGNLLLVHGTGDDNGHYQGTEMLINELIAHNKHFTVMPYPARSHAISEGPNTTRHFYGLLTRYLEQNLPAGPAPARSSAKAAGCEVLACEGWTVQVNERLRAGQPRELEKAWGLLKNQLAEINRVVPPAVVSELQAVQLWMSPEYPGIQPRAEYHPGAGWLREHGRNPAMEKGVEFTNIRIFEAETRRMPNFVLHELAHAYQDRVLGNNHAGINQAYDHAKASGKYDRVEQRFGDGRSTITRAYAMSNPLEYFAETTEAFFSTNDFFPFTRQELRQHDPEMYRLLGKLWRMPAKEPDPNP